MDHASKDCFSICAILSLEEAGSPCLLELGLLENVPICRETFRKNTDLSRRLFLMAQEKAVKQESTSNDSVDLTAVKFIASKFQSSFDETKLVT